MVVICAHSCSELFSAHTLENSSLTIIATHTHTHTHTFTHCRSAPDGDLDATADAGPRLVNLGAQEWVGLAKGNDVAGPSEGFSCVLLKEVRELAYSWPKTC
jgi:hypothetical protein